MHQNNDLISRQAAIDALARMIPRSCTPDGSHPADEEIFKAQEIYVDCIESIEILPAVQPEIIHCKDCKHHFTHRCMDSIPTEICDLNQTFYDAEVDFCSLAERRTE